MLKKKKTMIAFSTFIKHLKLLSYGTDSITDKINVSLNSCFKVSIYMNYYFFQLFISLSTEKIFIKFGCW